MAEVFLARTDSGEHAGRMVALKRVLPHLRDEATFVKMFFDEARIAERLLHPNICRVYEYGEEASQPYIAMELVHGKDLRSVLHRLSQSRALMPAHLAAFVAMRVAEALDFVHSAKTLAGQPAEIVHRDVSPANVLLSYDGVPKLIDFGIAKANARALQLQAGSIQGKVAYLSPEQVSGGTVDARSDIFSLGSILYEMLAAQPPFDPGNELAAIGRIASGECRPLGEVAPGVPAALGEVVARALSLRAQDRYQRAATMGSALSSYLMSLAAPVTESTLAGFLKRTVGADKVEEALVAEPESVSLFDVTTAEYPTPGEPPIAAHLWKHGVG